MFLWKQKDKKEVLSGLPLTVTLAAQSEAI